VRTAVDSSVLLDVLSAEPRFASASERALREAAQRGALLACPIVWAEMQSHFARPDEMRAAMAGAGIAFDPFDEACAALAGRLWADYRRAGGSRQRLIADFLVGAHAQVRADGRLLSRDRGFYRRTFAKLTVLP
jgi:predicted nucleic acid-binding protein